jgi:hypothetical protein
MGPLFGLGLVGAGLQVRHRLPRRPWTAGNVARLSPDKADIGSLARADKGKTGSIGLTTGAV